MFFNVFNTILLYRKNWTSKNLLLYHLGSPLQNSPCTMRCRLNFQSRWHQSNFEILANGLSIWISQHSYWYFSSIFHNCNDFPIAKHGHFHINFQIYLTFNALFGSFECVLTHTKKVPIGKTIGNGLILAYYSLDRSVRHFILH
jgi:hypothetical protein